MVFSSLTFLFWFMPIAFGAYYITPTRHKNLTLLIASLIFYSWGEIRYFPIMLSIILVNYFAGLAIERCRENKKLCKTILVASIVFSVGFLAVFKYADFMINNINALLGTAISPLKLTLPLGISFYTFQIMTYTVDVYLKKIEIEHNIINFGTFVVLFPQLIAGPIVKYSDLNSELKKRTITLEAVQEGIAIFIMGLASKVLIANSIGALWTDVNTLGFDTVSSALAWMAVIAYGLQVYFDFSGYSLMAIGMGKMLGFTFPKNFDYPFVSRSITEFWRRWHMTLSGWFKEYVYIPLGGSHCSKLRTYFNLFVVWFATGLWHGAEWNFVFWGLFFFVFLCIEKMGLYKMLERHRVFSHVYTIFVLQMGWVLFGITDLQKMGGCFIRLFSFIGGTDWMFYLRNYAGVFIVAILFSTPILNKIAQKLSKKYRWIFVPLLMILLLLSVAYLVDSTYNPFLYFRF